MTNAPSDKQIGRTRENGKRIEPTKCAVSNRDCKGKPHITHYGPDGTFVYVLAQYDHQWPQVAPLYGFPVEEVVEEDGQGFVFDPVVAQTVYPTGDNGAPGSFMLNPIASPQDAPSNNKIVLPGDPALSSARRPKPTLNESADSSKGDA